MKQEITQLCRDHAILDELRKLQHHNLIGAVAHIQELFNLTSEEASYYVRRWINKN